MRRSRPKQHYRKIKTKQGRKRILVNKGIIRKKNKTQGLYVFPNWTSKKKRIPKQSVDKIKYEYSDNTGATGLINWDKSPSGII